VSLAECSIALEVVGTSSEKVKLFDENGKRAGEIDKSQAVERPVVACNETYGIVKIRLADNREVWIDRGETQAVKGATTEATNTRVCLTSAPSKDPTNAHLASNGAQPENCSVKR
jgi:hypothetical protein